MIASCLLIRLVVSRGVAGVLVVRRWALASAALVGIAVITVLVIMPWQLTSAWSGIDDRAERARSWQPIIARIARAPGLARCRSLALCCWAGKPFEVDHPIRSRVH